METIFLLCAVVGGTVLVCQFVMTLSGLGDGHGDFDAGGHDFGGHGHDAGHHGDHDHHGSTWLFGVITFRTMVAALAFFGLAGRAAQSAGFEPIPTFLIALGAGVAAMYGVHFLMKGLHKLRSDGTIQIDRALGEQATVYLTIPAANSGCGKIHINLQNRLVEFQASTPHDKLPTGARVVVTRVVGPDTVEVQPLETPVRQTREAVA
jgi:hypothetical protein